MFDRMELKTRIYRHGLRRMVLAHALELSYPNFNYKLSYGNFTEQEMTKLLKIIFEAEAAQAAAAESDKGEPYYAR